MEESPQGGTGEQARGQIQGSAGSREVRIGDQLLRPEASQRIRNHSPNGFEWGYGGSGPAQLALAILLAFLPREQALNHYQDFKWAVVAGLPFGQDFSLPVADVEVWIRANVLGDEVGTECQSI
jgi:hypothetical protein